MKRLLSVQFMVLIFTAILSFCAYGRNRYPSYDEVRKPYVVINDNKPFFKDNEYSDKAVENYAGLDRLGRCGTAYAVLGKETMPSEERGNIGMIKPTGWNQAKYPGVVNSTPPYLYNRCHLIGFQLSGENDNERNLITGTRYLNCEGMLPFENMVAEYIKSKGNHVMYRVTPVFDGENLLASGVLIEALSAEDKGKGLSFCVYCYNVQPGVAINYTDGSNTLENSSEASPNGNTVKDSRQDNGFQSENVSSQNDKTEISKYVANRNTGKFHVAECGSVNDMKEKNKVFYSDRQKVIDDGYVPCKRCNP